MSNFETIISIKLSKLYFQLMITNRVVKTTIFLKTNTSDKKNKRQKLQKNDVF